MSKYQSINIANTNILKPLRANPTKWSNTLKQFVGKLSTNWLSVFAHFIKLALEGSGVLLVFERIVVEILETFSISI